MKAIFMGTPDFAVKTLEALIEKHEVVAVVTQPDKQKGRGKKFVHTPVKEVALKNNLELFQPENIKESSFIEKLKSFNADIFIVVAYGQLLSKEILEIPKSGCLNVHASLLPKYRGAAPIQRALINGEEETGVTIMFMDETLDTGDMILKQSIKITDDDTSSTLHDKLSVIGAETLLKALEQIENKTAIKEKQDDNLSSYAKMINKKMGHIDFNTTSKDIVNLIRGLDPWPSAYCYYKDELLKIWKAKVFETDKIGKPGEILDVLSKEGIVIKTKDSAIIATEIQTASSKRMKTTDYLRGRSILKGEVLK